MSNIKAFAFAKPSATTPIYALYPDEANEQDLKIEVGKVLNQLKTLSLRKDERQKINTGSGCWYCKKDQKDMVYIILCSTNYPERHAFAAINQLKDHLQKLGQYETEPDVNCSIKQSSLKMHAKGNMKQIATRYENLKNIDRISVASSHLEEIRSSVTDSTRKMINNQVELEDLQRKSQFLKGTTTAKIDHAHQFNDSANELERLMYWRNCKLKIIIGLVIVAILVMIIVPIVVKVKS